MGGLTDRSRARLVVGVTADGALCVRMTGELDLPSVSELGRQLDDLLARAPQPLELDLTDVTFLDSSGVAVLVRLANRFGSVRTSGASAPVRKVIGVLGLSRRFGLDGR
jgi:anti-sigma B factor antagonist